MTTDFTVVIPARYGSSRLPGKPLLDIAGQPMIQHVYQKALASDARRVIIATDDERIFQAAKGFGAEVCITLSGHNSGTDRLQEVARIYDMEDDEIVVNVQGDEPLIPPSIVNQVARNLQLSPEAGAATLSSPLTNIDQVFDSNIVKVVADTNGYALYFSRAPIPWVRDGFELIDKQLLSEGCFQRHIGLYAYRVALLNEYVTLGKCPIEGIESLEQLRLIWNGHRIHVAKAVEFPPVGVDTEEDLKAVCAIIESERQTENHVEQYKETV